MELSTMLMGKRERPLTLRMKDEEPKQKENNYIKILLVLAAIVVICVFIHTAIDIAKLFIAIGHGMSTPK